MYIVRFLYIQALNNVKKKVILIIKGSKVRLRGIYTRKKKTENIVILEKKEEKPKKKRKKVNENGK